eukprot:160994_1
MGADADGDGLLAVDGEAVEVGLGVLELGDGDGLHLRDLLVGAVVDEDRLTTPDDGAVLLVVHGLHLDLNVHETDHLERGGTDVVQGGEGVAGELEREGDEHGVHGVVGDAGLVLLLVGGLGVQDVLAEELLIEEGGLELLERLAGGDLNAALGNALVV